MRITKEQRTFFKTIVSKLVPNGKVYLFGSRTDDNARGGDIDILILSPGKIDYDTIAEMKYTFYDKFGEQKLDIIGMMPGEDDPFKRIVFKKAVEL
jgi:uncharacterized protein